MRNLLLILSLAFLAASCGGVRSDAYNFSRDGAHDGDDPWEATYDAVGWEDFGMPVDSNYSYEEGGLGF